MWIMDLKEIPDKQNITILHIIYNLTYIQAKKEWKIENKGISLLQVPT